MLAKAVGQSLKRRLADCIREQARSHSRYGLLSYGRGVWAGVIASRLTPTGGGSRLEPFVALVEGLLDEVGEGLDFGYVVRVCVDRHPRV